MNKKLAGLIIIPLLALLGACATSPEAKQKRQAEFAAKVAERKAFQKKIRESMPVCASEKDCEAKWGAAQVWMTKNAGYKLQMVTNSIIQTYSPTENSGWGKLYGSITKEAIGQGQYRITPNFGCDNIFGCSTPKDQLISDFQDYVNSAQP